jgi:hypothetical protein
MEIINAPNRDIHPIVDIKIGTKIQFNGIGINIYLLVLLDK